MGGYFLSTRKHRPLVLRWKFFKTVVLLGLIAFSLLTLLETTHKMPPQNVVVFGLAQLPVIVLPAFLGFIFQSQMEL